MEKKHSSQSRRIKYSTFIGKFFNLILNLIFLTMLSWFLLTVYFCVKKYFFNTIYIEQEMDGIARRSAHVISSVRPEVLAHINHYFYKMSDVAKVSINTIFDPLLTNTILILILGPFEIIILRGFIFILFLPIFILILFGFILDGLVQRDIRKLKGAKESSFFFHRVSTLAIVSVTIGFFIYMVIPIFISPFSILIPMTMFSAMLTMFSIKNFKKYI